MQGSLKVNSVYVPLLAECPFTAEPTGRRDVRTMYLRVTISAAVSKKLFYFRVIYYGMSGMTLQTEKRHGCVKKMVIDRSVRSMAIGAVFSNICMLESKRSLLFHMAPCAGFFRCIPYQKLVLGGAMGIMTVNAGHFLLT